LVRSDSPDQVIVPFVAGQADLDLLQTVSAFVSPTLGDHMAAIETGGQELAEAGARVDLVPVWAPLFLVWCDEKGVDRGAADVFERWANRQGLVGVSYTHYEGGPIAPLIELEEVRSWALRSVLADATRHSERGIASVWAAASAFLEIVGRRASAGSELDVSVPTWTDPAHWHLDGSCCEQSSPALDHVHAALMEGLAIDGAAVLVEPAGSWSSLVRVWDLSPTGIRPLSAAEAAHRCHPQPGAVLIDAWRDPVSR